MVRTVLRARSAYRVGEDGLTLLTRAIGVMADIGHRGDQPAVAINIDVGRGRPAPEQIHCVNPTHLVAVGGQRDLTRRWCGCCRCSCCCGSSSRCRRGYRSCSCSCSGCCSSSCCRRGYRSCSGCGCRSCGCRCRRWRWRCHRCWCWRRCRRARFIRANVANRDAIAIAVNGAYDATLIELVYGRHRADSLISCIDRHAACAERHRLGRSPVIRKWLQIDLRRGRLRCAAASAVVCQIVAVCVQGGARAAATST